MQALGEACCLQPMPYHFHQQQVKVLVHNPILPAFHPFSSPMGPSIIEIPRETKPSALISPQRLPQIGPGTGDDNNQSQQQGQQQQLPAQVQSQQGLHSPQQPPPTGEQEPKGNFSSEEMPDNKTDIKEPVIGGNEEEDKKAPKRCHNGNGDKSIVCKTESDKKNSSEPSVKSIKLSKENAKANNPSSSVSDGKVAVESEGNLSGKKSKNESHNSHSGQEKSQAENRNSSGKKKKSKDGERDKKSKDGEKSKEKKKKKKEKALEGCEKGEKSVKKKKKKKKDGAVVDGENPGKPKKIKKKKKNHNNPDAIPNGTTSTGTEGGDPGKSPIANSDNKPKKKKKKFKEKGNGAKPSSEGKSKKKKVVSSKKKLSSAANPEIPGKGQEKVSTT